jgi:hypothetical protein
LIPGPISEKDALELYEKTKALLPVSQQALNSVVAAEARFDKLKIAGLVKISTSHRVS